MFFCFFVFLLGKSASEGRASPLVGLLKVDGVAGAALLHPADSLDERHGSGVLSTTGRLVDDLDDRLGDVLEAHCPHH